MELKKIKVKYLKAGDRIAFECDETGCIYSIDPRNIIIAATVSDVREGKHFEIKTNNKDADETFNAEYLCGEDTITIVDKQ